jgi:polyhydroxyalkanoate synthesis regulator phasin
MARLNLDEFLGNSSEGENISIKGVSLEFESNELPEIMKGLLPFMKMVKDSVADHNGRELEKLCSDYNERGKQLSEARAEISTLKAEVSRLEFEVRRLKNKEATKTKSSPDVGHVSLDSLDPDSSGVKLWD